MKKISKLVIHYVDDKGESKVVNWPFEQPVGAENTPSVYLVIKQFFDTDFNEKSE